MNEYIVNCVNKRDRMSTHEHITHIGSISSGTPWRMSRDKAISQIDSKVATFYTVDRTTGKRMYIGVVREPNKFAYLRTHADGKWNDNLLAQFECTSSCELL